MCLSRNYLALSDDIVEAESVAIVEAESDIIDDESLIVVVVSVEVSVDSVFFEQAVVRAIMAMKKKAVFVIAFIILGCFCLSEINGTMSTLIPDREKGNPTIFNFFWVTSKLFSVLTNESM